MKLTERSDWVGGTPVFEIDLQLLQLTAGSEIRVLSDSYSVDDEDIDFGFFTENDAGGPLHIYSTVSVPLAVVELSAGGRPVFGLAPSAEAGITSPTPPTVAPCPGVLLYSIRLAEMRGRREEVRIRAHGYRTADDAVWFYLELPRPGERFDIASMAAALLDGAPWEAITEIGDEPDR